MSDNFFLAIAVIAIAFLVFKVHQPREQTVHVVQQQSIEQDAVDQWQNIRKWAEQYQPNKMR